jgi:hypothetical protein
MGFIKNNHITRKTPMEEIDLFREKLQQHLQWNSARLAFVSIFLIALTRVKTVNLAEIATGFSGKAKVESHYKRLQNFFRDFEVDYESIALMIVKVMLSVGLLRLCSVVLNPVAFVWSPLIFKIRSASLN